MKLIDNAGQLWHRLWAVRLAALTTMYTTAAGAWMVLPGDLKPDLSQAAKLILAGVGVILPMLTGLARVVRQPNTMPENPKCSP